MNLRSSIIAFILISLSIKGFSQAENIIIDINYGLYGMVKGEPFYNFESSHRVNDENNEIDYNSTYVGPVAIRIQYMASSNFGIGLEGNYTYRNINWSENYQNYPPNFYSVTQSVYRIMLRTSWEFVNEQNYQMYWSNNIGARRAFWEGDYNNFYYWLNTNNNGGWPIAFRSAVGFRYWFHENIGMNSEIGFSGGSLLNFGISSKF